MSYHSTMEWKWEDGCTDELVDELVKGLLENREYNRSEGHDKFMGVYGTFSLVDQIMYNAGKLLDLFDGTLPEDSNAVIDRFSEGAPDPDTVHEILEAVVARMRDRDEITEKTG